MTDRIRISRIGVFAYHGVHPEEQRLGQRFNISLDLSLDLSEAGRNDDFGKTVCYSTLCERVQEVAVGQNFHTIEGLGEAVAAMALAENPRIESITVTVEKPGAPIPAIIEGIAVEITRVRRSPGKA